MRRPPVAAGLPAVILGALLALSGCGQTPPAGQGTDGGASTSTSTGSGRISVVTSTNVYGSIAEAVGGDAVEVTSIISNPEQDPHSYEGSTQVALQLSKAKLVIENGGGYDDFVDTMLKASDNQPAVLNAVKVSGLQAPAGEELNEHVWYSLPSVALVADEIAAQLGKVAPDKATTFTANAAAFRQQVDKLIRVEGQLKGKYQGVGVGITEPVPGHLLDAVGLENQTPEEFSEAVEEGEDVAPAVLKETLDLYSNKAVEVLVYNEQTSGPVTEQVKTAAERAGVAVVGVTETLPQGQSYLTWMQGNVDRLGQALAGS